MNIVAASSRYGVSQDFLTMRFNVTGARKRASRRFAAQCLISENRQWTLSISALSPRDSGDHFALNLVEGIAEGETIEDVIGAQSSLLEDLPKHSD